MIYEKYKHYYWLDLIRFIAAFLVVIVHTRHFVFVDYAELVTNEKTIWVTVFYAFTRIGQESVIAFFILSGFLVGGRAIERISIGTFNVKNYAIDRFVRIMLPLIPALILTDFVSLYLSNHISFIQFIGNLFSLQGVLVPVFGGNAPLWSLAYEVWFYVLLYAIGLSVVKKHYAEASILLFFIVLIFTVLSPVYLFCWLIGTYAYLVKPSHKSLLFFFIAIATVLYGIFCIEIGIDSHSLATERIKTLIPSLDIARIIFSVGIAMVIQQLLLMKPNKSFLINLNGLGTSLSASSYTLYLTHYPLLMLIAHFGITRYDQITIASVGLFVFSVIFCLLVSWLLYLMFEKHTNTLRIYLKNRCK